MKTNFTEQQVKWAREHDWFIRGNTNEIVCHADSDEVGARETFTNFQSLRDWAGY